MTSKPKRSNFTIIPNEVIDTVTFLKDSAFSMLIVLYRCGSWGDNEFQAVPIQALIAQTGLSWHTIRARMNVLVSHGLVREAVVQKKIYYFTSREMFAKNAEDTRESLANDSRESGLPSLNQDSKTHEDEDSNDNPTSELQQISMPNADEMLWLSAKEILRQQMTQATYAVNIQGTSFIERKDDVFIIGVTNEMSLDWLQHRLRGTVERALTTVVGQSVSIEFELKK